MPVPKLDTAVKALSLTKEEEAPHSSSSRENGSTLESSSEALRDLRDEMRSSGFLDADDLLRALAVAAGRRVWNAYQCDPGKSPAWLRTVMRDGASRMRGELDGISELDRRRIAAFDAMYERSTGRRWGGSA